MHFHTCLSLSIIKQAALLGQAINIVGVRMEKSVLSELKISPLLGQKLSASLSG